MACEKLLACPFFNDKMPLDRGLGSLFKRRYCEGDNALCARYIVATKLGKEYVPSDLYPNMNRKADYIIGQHGDLDIG